VKSFFDSQWRFLLIRRFIMSRNYIPGRNAKWPTLAQLPLPAKALVSVIILTMAIAMVGALGQIIVHDIIPTFFSGQPSGHLDNSDKPDQHASNEGDQASSGRGDLFSEELVEDETPMKQAWYLTEQFVWTLKWTHIHLFGINMIFIFMGAITIFLNISTRARTLLIIFWLHIPGGGLFGIVFTIVAARAFWEMSGVRKNYAQH
jgi:hypothetical protein